MNKFMGHLWDICGTFLLIFMLVMLASAEQSSLGVFKQNTCVILKQTCSNCTFVNITSIISKDINGASIQLLGNVGMTKIGTEYNYTFCNTSNLGEYTYNTLGDINGNLAVAPVIFEINPSGNQENGWTTTIQIFSSISTLILMLLFLNLSNSKSKNDEVIGASKEKGIIRFFFLGLAMIFLIAHVLITYLIINNIIGQGVIERTYGYVMYIFFSVIILFFLYILIRITFNEVDNFKMRIGLK